MPKAKSGRSRKSNAEKATIDPERCPTCGKPFATGRPVRVCMKCGKTIGKLHKWQFVTVAGKTWIQHRVCDNPTSYHA